MRPSCNQRICPTWHHAFLAMLPKIRGYARVAFANLRGDERDDAIQETIANCCTAFVRLVQQGRAAIAYPTTLVRFAVAQVRQGREVGTPMNVRDVLSPYAQRTNRFAVKRLDYFDKADGCWIEAVIDDPHTPVFDQVWFRIDFPEWLARLSPRHRKIAEMLVLGNATKAVARRFGISPGRVSQLRRELYESWQELHGESDRTRDIRRGAQQSS